MNNNKSNKGISHLNNQPSDSFVIDLRAALKKPMAESAAIVKKESGHKSWLKAKEKVNRKEKRHVSTPDFTFKLKAAKKPANSLATMASVFKRHFEKEYFVSPRRYRWRVEAFFRSVRFHLPKSALRARRRFARQTNLHWAHLAKLTGLKNSKEETRAEFLVNWYRSLFAFVAALIFIILPFKLLAYFKILDVDNLKNVIASRSFSAFDNLAAASNEVSDLNLAAAGSSFAKASSDFSSAQAELSRVDDWLFSLAAFSNDPKIKLAAAGKKILAIGTAGAEFGRQLSDAGEIFLKADDDRSWGKLVDAFVEHGAPALASAKDLQILLADINPDDLPEEYRDRYLSFKGQADLAVEALDTLLSSAQEIKEFLGVSQDKRYLLVFQNNTEMRGAGGFFGSYALVDIRDGRIRKLEVPAGGSYDTEAGMTSFVRSPRPLWLVNPRWYLWDANWWPDWPTSARSLMWFYEKSDGPTVDGVISFTPDVLEDLLRITGPIDLKPDYDMTVSADNFWELIQATVEKDNLEKTHPLAVADLPDSPENMPKKIIGDLMARILERLPAVLTADNAPALAQALDKNLSAKNIMMYFTDPELQAKISNYHLDGSILPAKQDYLLVAHTNIAGQKSDRRMEEQISHSAEILSDGSVIDTVIIKRTHTGIKNEILTGVRNVDWLRVYVPAGSQLLEASGFTAPDAGYFEEPDPSWENYSVIAENEDKAGTDLPSGTKIYSENEKTVFANWVMTDPGETSLVRLRYRLPFKIKKTEVAPESRWWSELDSLLNRQPAERASFSLLWQKQPGAKAAAISFDLKTPAAWRSIWNYPDNTGWNGTASLDADRLRAVLLEK